MSKKAWNNGALNKIIKMTILPLYAILEPA